MEKKQVQNIFIIHNGKIEQINECRGNVTFGVSKEFEEKGNLRSVNIVWNNDYLKISI